MVRDAAVEAVELARFLHALMPDEPAVIGLLALVLLQQARRSGRFDAEGVAVPLRDQDRSGWDSRAVTEGVALRWEFDAAVRFGAAEPVLARDLLFAAARILSTRLRMTSNRIRR